MIKFLGVTYPCHTWNLILDYQKKDKMKAKKVEWRKSEKQYYLPKNKPEVIEIPSFKFLTIEGEGKPGNEKLQWREI